MNHNKPTVTNELESLLLRRIDILNNIIKTAEEDIDASPEGCLRMYEKHGTNQYYCCDHGDKHGKYIKKSDQALMQKLAQKDYALSALSAAKNELVALTAYINMFQADLASSLAGKLPKYKLELINPYIDSDANYIEHWKSIKAKIKSDYAEQHPRDFQIPNDGNEITTEQGERVRSKSEKIIADKLYYMHIPYSYECPLHLQNFGYIKTDFTALNVRTRHEYYWEHLGSLDNYRYCDGAIIKIETYEENNTYPGKDLILTYETQRHPVNSTLLGGIISEYLL